jgi:5-methylcytosine-specific restriction endonuclease McrA
MFYFDAESTGGIRRDAILYTLLRVNIEFPQVESILKRSKTVVVYKYSVERRQVELYKSTATGHTRRNVPVDTQCGRAIILHESYVEEGLLISESSSVTQNGRLCSLWNYSHAVMLTETMSQTKGNLVLEYD